jgi:hypothetical protein
MNRRLELTIGLVWAVTSVLLIILGSLGTWVSIGPLSIDGSSTDAGVVCIALGGAAAIAVLWTRVPRWVVLVLALAVAAIGTYHVAAFSAVGSVPLFGQVTPGWGVLLLATGGVSLIAWAIVTIAPGRTAVLVALIILGAAAPVGGAVAGAIDSDNATEAQAGGGVGDSDQGGTDAAISPEIVPPPSPATSPDLEAPPSETSSPDALGGTQCANFAEPERHKRVLAVAAIGPTSCPFARKVAEAAQHADASDADTTITVFSRATQSNVKMRCSVAEAEDVIRCTGGNEAEVAYIFVP